MQGQLTDLCRAGQGRGGGARFSAACAIGWLGRRRPRAVEPLEKCLAYFGGVPAARPARTELARA